MKESQRIIEKLTAIRNRWNEESNRNADRIAEVSSRLNTAQEALTCAEDPSEYAHAQRAVEAAKTDLSFYEMQRTKFVHCFTEDEYKKTAAEIYTEQQKIIKASREEIRADLEKVINKMIAFEEEMATLTRAKNLLNKMSNKSTKTVYTAYPALLSPTDPTKQHQDIMTYFCAMYARLKQTKIIK